MALSTLQGGFKRTRASKNYTFPPLHQHFHLSLAHTRLHVHCKSPACADSSDRRRSESEKGNFIHCPANTDKAEPSLPFIEPLLIFPPALTAFLRLAVKLQKSLSPTLRRPLHLRFFGTFDNMSAKTVTGDWSVSECKCTWKSKKGNQKCGELHTLRRESMYY